MRSKKFHPRILAAAFVLLTVTTQALGQGLGRVAVLTDVQGQVMLARAGSDTFSGTGEFGTPLYTNDRLRTGESASASILYSNGDLLTIGASRSIMISNTADGLTGSASRIKVDKRVSSTAASLALHRSGDGEIAALSGLRSSVERATISVVSPSNSAVRSSTPLFSWTASETFSLFRVRVFNSTGIVWEGESTSTNLEYPSDAPVLNAGVDYLWQVFGENMLDVEGSEISRIRVLTQESLDMISEAEENLASSNIKASSGNYHLLLGSLYAESRLLSDAADEFKALIEEYPGTALPYELLAKIFAEMGRIDLAMDAFRTASANAK
ncbi:MAG: hypothetical protein BMS9Abin05_1986 [Rhodothermia bacterium]|nr:MAG: hypothetical protein BMS9Abin05_1986 [Rhodothermia bacterium]